MRGCGFPPMDSGEDTDMLIGADFFLSHRIYVASSQRKLFFTYNGGPVFNLGAPAPSKTAAEPPAAESAGDGFSAEPTDAAGFSRRGTAFAARRDFEHALADLTRACELAPDNAQYFYQRAIAYRDNKQPDLAMADLNRALQLKSDDTAALSERASLRLTRRDDAGAIPDLDALDRILPKENDMRLLLAQAYGHVGLSALSIAQYDLWIQFHSEDARMPEALNSRCWDRALQGVNLAEALADCNRALKLAGKASPLTSRVLDSRGLVRLRMGDYDKSITDYDESLRQRPKNAWSLYGRGLAELRKSKVAEGGADMAAATALWAPIGDEFKRHGMTP